MYVHLILSCIRVNHFVVLGVNLGEGCLTVVENREVQRGPRVDGLLEDRSIIENDAPNVNIDRGIRGRRRWRLYDDGCGGRLLHHNGCG